ncbi:coenzyme F420-reducing hydrogenase beta subunit [Aminivibrio pyruvatiphilus]|uniref:Coenzyme F420-reducing hydrogenase beta subunit n=1 Tax=Aminivibrio pyruvatiphilus TaxID=1005740 RepID=A0A4R8LY10_9BACT|nr:Coenzyme F420 hydrogenase/dehydrogenase, beta subunit C-terminal domain [Aminivibrio pyruvatiphilus]TDY52096.1 coenzyme F420-reducing hydrogenase beta subunit [Aminivibrio pyruvatiphilus]
MKNVFDLVVQNNLCSGCGVCAGVCPAGNLAMEWNEQGEYMPTDQGRCIDSCTLCLRVCPFYPGNPDENQLGKERFEAINSMQHTPETGFWLACYAGAVSDEIERGKSASGGFASWVLGELLANGFVDEVICVEPNEDPEKLFRFARLDKPEDLERARGSAYYPVEFSEMMRYIKRTNKQFAVIGLPCFVKAIRLAARADKTLERKIPFLLGIVCGQMKSRKYTQYIASLAGVEESLEKVYFRGKRNDAPASDYNFLCRGISGKEGKISWTEGVSRIWGDRWFTLESCGYCDDIFAETADAVFMDAWLPEYVNDSRGTSLAIIRNPEILKILERNSGSQLDLSRIPVEKIIQSQQGVIENKRKVLSYRLSSRPKTIGERPLTKRVPPDVSALNCLARYHVDAVDSISSETRAWDIPKESAGEFRARISPELKRLQRISKIVRFASLPRRAAGKILRAIKKKAGRK